ncbi:hypothetical protein PMZ80_000806 [Knufia obscura]|uniref:Uncharacterized protein n=1 Tax=Knufia obscura TaxID=1635080 RepID=A0ABR0S1C7_9EURO|nr:hypothetical protein PMZ80_000806 [Knufia obscura]
MEEAAFSAPQLTGSPYPQALQEINVKFGAIDHASREVFLDTIRMKCVFVELRFFRNASKQTGRNLQRRLDYYFKDCRARAMHPTMKVFPNKYSVIRIDLRSNNDRAVLFPTCINLFCADRLRLLLVCHIVWQHVERYHELQVTYQARSRSGCLVIDQILETLGAASGYIQRTDVTANTPGGHGMLQTKSDALFCRIAPSRTVSAGDILKQILDYHLRALGELRSGRMSFIQLLPLAAEGLGQCRWTLVGRSRAQRAIALQYISYVGLVFHGLSRFMLHSKNIHNHQLHYLLKDNSSARTVMRRALSDASEAKRSLLNWTLRPDRPLSYNIFGALFELLKARTQLLLAFARAGSMPGFSISTLVRGRSLTPNQLPSGEWRGLHARGSDNSELNSSTHVQLACSSIDRVRQVCGRLRESGNPVSMNLDRELQWAQDAEAMLKSIESAMEDRGMDVQRDVLVDPMMGLEHYSFQLYLAN